MVEQGGIPPRTASPGNRVPRGIAVAWGRSCGVSRLVGWLVGFFGGFLVCFNIYFSFSPKLGGVPWCRGPN